MKIGFDVSQTGSSKAGCGYVADALITALTRMDMENTYLLYPFFGGDFRDPDALKTTRQIDRRGVRRIPIGRSAEEGRRFWAEMTPDKEAALGRPDIIHANNFFCPTGLSHARLVYTLHDISFLRHPEFTTEENRLVCFGGVFKAAMHADAIIAVSDYSRRSFLDVFPHYPADKIAVVHLGSRFTPDAPADPPPDMARRFRPWGFWLSVGTLEPRKNLRRMLQGYAEHQQAVKEPLPLVLAGGKGWMEDDLEAYIHQLGLGGDVVPLGYVSDAALAWLYRNCYAFVYPSLYEGFGLPVLEAMSLGAAVVTSSVTSLPEVGGEAALYVDPLDTSDIARAFSALAHDGGLRERLKARALVQAEKFSWEQSAARTLAVYRQLMEGVRPLP